MSAYLIDTSICIDVIRGRNPTLLHRFQQANLDDLAISTITLAELEYGVARTQFREHGETTLRNFCVGIQVLPFDAAAASAYGRLRAELKAASITIGPMDLLIAAHALALRAIIVTGNEREFRRVPGLSVETWR